MSRRVAASLAVLGVVNLVAPHLPDPGRKAQIAALALVSFPLATLVIAALAPDASRQRGCSSRPQARWRRRPR